MNRFPFHPGGWQEGSLLLCMAAEDGAEQRRWNTIRSSLACAWCTGNMWAAILISSAPREDMASRIFLPAAAL